MKLMILGMAALTLVHVLLSLVGIATGLLVLLAMFSAKRSDGMTAVFLSTTVLTSATGFLFPFHKLLPSHILGAISLVALAIAIFARYGKQLAGGWNRTYVITAVLSLYLNVFVLIAQAFMKVPALKPLAPTQSEPPFLVTQLVCMLIFIVLGVLAAKNFRTA
jgi:hypothetical protein